jgi:glycosyltransferase involved in cell wall biosynthesis
MRILFVTSALNKEFGGPPVAVVGAAKSLSLLGHNVEIYVAGQDSQNAMRNINLFDVLEASGVDFYIAKSRKTGVYGGVGSIPDWTELYRRVLSSEVVSAHGVYSYQNIILSIMTFFARRPYTVMPHGTLTNYQRGQHKLRKKFFGGIFEYLYLRRSVGLLVASDVEKQQLPPRLKPKAMVVGLGIDLPLNQVIEAKPDADPYVFLHMGRIAEKKKIETAIRAFAKLVKTSNRSFKFLICGKCDDNYLIKLKELIEFENVSNYVEFRGWVDSSAKELAFTQSDCFVLASDDENFAIAVAEAMSHGLPCIVSRGVALSKVVSEFQAGIVIEKNDSDSLACAMNNQSNTDRQISRNNALSAAETLMWNYVAQNWENEFEKIVHAQSSS